MGIFVSVGKGEVESRKLGGEGGGWKGVSC